MHFYKVGFGIWVLMLLLSMVNNLEIFKYQLPNSELNATDSFATITELKSSTAQQYEKESILDVFGGIGMLIKSMKYMLSTFVDSINIIGLARQYSIDDRISAPFQALYLFILGYGFWQWLSGRSGKGIE